MHQWKKDVWLEAMDHLHGQKAISILHRIVWLQMTRRIIVLLWSEGMQKLLSCFVCRWHIGNLQARYTQSDQKESKPLVLWMYAVVPPGFEVDLAAASFLDLSMESRSSNCHNYHLAWFVKMGWMDSHNHSDASLFLHGPERREI
jgi:hypothetical protein